MAASLVRRSDVVLRPDPSRVLARQFLPGQELLADGRPRVDAVVSRVLGMPDAVVAQTLEQTRALFRGRHDELSAVFLRHFAPVAQRVAGRDVDAARQELIGAYFTQEYALESAALFNPSAVASPDQTGVPDGGLRFLMTVRSVGEGHLSSIQLRTGVLGADGEVSVDVPDRPRTGRHSTARVPREVLLSAYSERHGGSTELLRPLMPETVDGATLDATLDAVAGDFLDPHRGRMVADRLRRLFDSDYTLTLDEPVSTTSTVLFPQAPAESNGMEDARLTRFVDDDGRVEYLATYTAYDGSEIACHLVRTTDFRHYTVQQLLGPAAASKGMALFPRRVGGELTALVRWDREAIGVARSTDFRRWGTAAVVQRPVQPWEVIQLGNCGPPIETEAGWLVLNHGVGPVRRYGIGALLLDRDDPTRMIGALADPLLTPAEDEREGYVPNVVYSCGGLTHGDTLMVPYGCSDVAIRFALVDLPALLDRLTSP